jgi:hypothetical protein
MQNSYLKVFDNLFFDVEKHDEVKKIIEQASYVLDLVITRFGEVENEMTIGTSRIDDFVDTVIILFIRKIMEQLDSINVLYSVSLFEPAQIILRSLIENIIGLEFILKDDTQKRSAAYYLEHHYQELDKSELYFNAESEYGKLIIAQKGKDEFDEDCKKLEKKRQALERLIKSKTVFEETDTARKRKLETKKKKIGKKKKVYIQWYEVCSNITSLYGLMKETGYEKYYDAIYGGLSFESHGLNATMGMNVNEDGYSLKFIRNPEGGSTTFGLACSFSIGVLHKIYQYLEDEESEIEEFKVFFEEFVKKRDIASCNLDMIRSASSNGS